MSVFPSLQHLAFSLKISISGRMELLHSAEEMTFRDKENPQRKRENEIPVSEIKEDGESDNWR